MPKIMTFGYQSFLPLLATEHGNQVHSFHFKNPHHNYINDALFTNYFIVTRIITVQEPLLIFPLLSVAYFKSPGSMGRSLQDRKLHPLISMVINICLIFEKILSLIPIFLYLLTFIPIVQITSGIIKPSNKRERLSNKG